MTNTGANRPVDNWTVWYPQGAGGMWLNYLLWCNKNQTILPGNFQSFEFDNLRKQYPEYSPFFIFVKHLANQDLANQSTVRLGGDSWFNFYLNISAKKSEGHYYGNAISLLAILNTDVTINLNWQDIVQDPKKFLADLEGLMKWNIPYDSITQEAIDQYIQSCSFPRLDDEFRATEVYKEWARAVRDIQHIESNDEIFEFTQANYCSP
jgi:hypothetical protein